MAQRNIDWVNKAMKAKSATIIVNPKNFRSTLAKLGVSVPKGATSYTFSGNFNSLVSQFSPLAGRTRINPHDTKKATRYTGLIVGEDIKTITIKASRQTPDRGNSAGKLKLGERIKYTDERQFINFGLRADGTARTGYTLGQCLFSYEYRRAGERGDYDRYEGGGNYNKSVLHRVRVKLGLEGRAKEDTE